MVRRSLATLMLIATGCTSFVSADVAPADDGGGTGATGLGSTTAPAPDPSDTAGQGSTAGLDETTTTGSNTTAPVTTDPGTSGSDVTTSGDAEGSTSVAGSSSSSTGNAESSDGTTGAVIVTCEDLVLEESTPLDCSENSADEASLSIYNDCAAVSIEVLWVDYDCAEQSYGTRAPGETFTISTYQTHPWRVRNAETGELMREIPPLTGDTALNVLER